MSNTFLPFSKPCISQEAINEVIDCLKSGWLTTGPRVKLFEEKLSHYLQAPHTLALISATAGLHLALTALNLQPGDEVITTPLTFVASLNTIVIAGGKPVLIDVDPHTYNIDVNLLEAAITPRTRAILPVHFTGQAVDLDPIYQLADKYGLRVIEDAAQAIGTQYKGKLIGSFGDTQVFSFHPNKVMTTGEGGCVTTRDAALAKMINLLRFHGIDREAWNRNAKEGSQVYDVVAPGYKYNMMDMQAALGIHQLNDLESFIEKRTLLAQRYLNAFKDWPELTLPGIANFEQRHSWYIFCPLINETFANMNRDTFIEKMKEENIGVGLHYIPAHLYTFYQDKYGYKAGDFPHAENIGQKICSLPLFPQMTFNEQDRVIETMGKILKR
ncbi:MAG: UDP-4-amino-4-deoxy-L-arabinose--oxoglutarate aminotransferase [Legionellaceae bacterium]